MEGDERSAFTRSLRHAFETHETTAIDAALVEIGWTDALAHDARDAISALFEIEGATLGSSSALDDTLGAAIGLDTAAAVGVVLPALGQWSPPGMLAQEGLIVRGLGTAALARRETTLVVAGTAGSQVTYALPRRAVTLRRVHGLDPDLGLVEVSGTVPADTIGPEVPSAPWTDAVALAQLALGYELVGVSRQMLELARRHALAREQFGRPISEFQAVRHRLADALVAIESADAVLGAAKEDGLATTAAVAKALAGRGARTVARHCQQVLAGIGFTTEHEFHRYARRAMVLDEVFGASRTLTNELGAELLAARRVPELAPL